VRPDEDGPENKLESNSFQDTLYELWC
jgi:hypothetical protein